MQKTSIERIKEKTKRLKLLLAVKILYIITGDLKAKEKEAILIFADAPE
tara:strand:+ start:283 stop:429 length:147 start_codon:yes stop_codon:yes gene_type:complete